MSIFVPKNTYPSTKAREFVCNEVKHVLNQLIRGQITTSTTMNQKQTNKNKKQKNKLTPFAAVFFFKFCFVLVHKLLPNVLEFTPYKNLKPRP
jgi:hypothetical protein